MGSDMRNAARYLPLILLLALATGLPLVAQSSPSSSSPSANIAAADATRGQKLILKNGTIQIVSQYQVIGDRVRFYSVDRSDWEEIPASLVDWDATRKAADQTDKRENQAIALAHQVDLEAHPGSLDVDAGLGLPPGMLLPSGDGMFAYNGRAIFPFNTDLAKSKLDKGRFVAKLISPIPVVATRYNIFLEGKRAKTRIADPEPVFYFRTHNGAPPNFQLMRASVKGGNREFASLNEYMGQKRTDAAEIPMNAETIDPDTIRLMAGQDLAPGEYVLAETLPETKTVDLYVWDFGIDPSAKTPAKK